MSIVDINKEGVLCSYYKRLHYQSLYNSPSCFAVALQSVFPSLLLFISSLLLIIANPDLHLRLHGVVDHGHEVRNQQSSKNVIQETWLKCIFI